MNEYLTNKWFGGKSVFHFKYTMKGPVFYPTVAYRASYSAEINVLKMKMKIKA